MPAVPPKPYEQQLDEGGVPFAAFKIYRDLGPTRSIDESYRTSRAHTGVVVPTKRMRAPGYWHNWSRRWNWDARAKAWDSRADRIELEAREKVIAKHAATDQERQRRHMEREETLNTKLYEKLLAMAEFGLSRKVSRSADGKEITIFEPARWKLSDFIKGIRVHNTAGRVLTQLPTVVMEAASDAVDELFVTSSGQQADRLPDGAMPPMPDDVAARPEVGTTIAVARSDLIQPNQAQRPKMEDLMPGGNGHGHNGGNGGIK